MLEHIDQQVFLFLNSLHSPFWDNVMYTISGKFIWAPLYLAILIYLGFTYKRKFLILILFVALAITLSDQLSVILKNLTLRLRPCHEPAIKDFVHLVHDECGGLYSFVSSHASNSFMVAFLSLSFIRTRWYTICIILWAAIVGYSRIYLGVHYPGDVLFGSVVGALVGWGIYKFFILTEEKVLNYRPYFNPEDSRKT